MSTNHTRVISEERYGEARRAAARAALASFDSSFLRWSEVVEVPGLLVAAGKLEDVSSQQLRELGRDIDAELQRRGHSEVQDSLHKDHPAMRSET